MKNFEYTNYAINKANSDAIVYRFANGEVREITAANFGGDEEAFRKWKNFSDEDYHNEDNHNRSVSRKDISIHSIEETDLGYSESCAEIIERKEDTEQIRSEVEELLSHLSEKQRRRLYLACIKNINQKELAKAEGCSQPVISESITNAKNKIRKIYKKISETSYNNASKMAVSERINFYERWLESHTEENENPDSILTTE